MSHPDGMRLVYITAQVPYGPKEAFLLPEARELARQGHEVVMLPLRPAADRPVPEPLKAVRLPLVGPRTVALAVLEACRHPLRLLGLLQHLGRASGTPLKLIKNLAVVPKALAAARVVRGLAPDHLHAHWASTPATMAYLVAAWCGLPWSFTMHRWDIEENNMLAEKVRTARFARVINQRGLAVATRIVGETLARKCHVLHMGVDVGPPPAPLAPVQRPLVLACPANLVAVKGHRYLLEACRLLKEQGIPVECWLIGDGPLEAELQAQVTAGGLDDVVSFKGRWPHQDVLAGYRGGAVDAVVLPSILTEAGEQEGIPVALMEAMAAGIPVIGTDSGGIPELLEGEAGLLVPQKDAAALAQAIMRLATEPALRAALREQGYARVASAFHLPTVAAQLVGYMEVTR